MNKKFLSFILILASGCTQFGGLNSVREPAAKVKDKELVFNLSEPNYQKLESQNFELVNLSDIKNKKVSFKIVKVSDLLKRDVLDVWRKDLETFKEEVFTESFGNTLFFEFDKYSVRLKKDDIENLQSALSLLDKTQDSTNLKRYKQLILVDGFMTLFKSPYEFETGGLSLVGELFKRAGNYKIAKGGTEPINVESSVFWKNVDVESEFSKILAEEETFTSLITRPCTYDSPKRGYGTHLNFKVKCDNRKFKLKLGEQNGAPLNSKIYRMLGYHVPTVFYAKNVQVAWTKKIFTEMNQSRAVAVMGTKVSVKPKYASYVQGAYLKSGEFVEAKDFFARLAPKCPADKPECIFDEKQIDPEFDANISTIVFKDVALLEEIKQADFGKWSYDHLDYSQRLELKSLLVVGALTGNHDLRRDNTALILDTSTSEVKFYLADVGSGYGAPKSFSSFDISKMTYEVMKKSIQSNGGGHGEDTGGKSEVIDVFGYASNAIHQSFKNLQTEEGKWIAKRILSISEDKVKKCFELSGLSPQEVELGTEKFVSRQKNIGEVFQVIDAFPALKERKINKVEAAK